MDVVSEFGEGGIFTGFFGHGFGSGGNDAFTQQLGSWADSHRKATAVDSRQPSQGFWV